MAWLTSEAVLDVRKAGNLAKTWVLDTETKGTGAEMVPLEKVLRKSGSDAVPGFAFPELREPPRASAEAPAPRKFRVIDVMSRRALADEVDARGAVRALESVRSVVDVTVHVWEPVGERWRRLTFEETTLLWEYRGRLEPATG